MMNKTKTGLRTGSGTGFGWPTAQTLAKAGHKVVASMCGVAGKNAAQATSLSTQAREDNADFAVVELAIASDESVEQQPQKFFRQVMVNRA